MSAHESRPSRRGVDVGRSTPTGTGNDSWIDGFLVGALQTLLGCVLWTCSADSRADKASHLAGELSKYNHVRMSDEAKSESIRDDPDATAFIAYRFKCRQQKDWSDEESQEAKAALDRFMALFSTPASSAEEKKARLAALETARAAGSWRADYIDVMWGIWSGRRTHEEQPFFDRLGKLVDKGIPVAIQGYFIWTNGLYEYPKERASLLRHGIERGSPFALRTVGYALGVRTQKQRQKGLAMLKCAAAQGEADAYDGLGQIAWLEG